MHQGTAKSAAAERRLLERVRGLHDRALQSAARARQSEAVRLMRRAVSLLDHARPADAPVSVDRARTRARLLVSLAFSVAETGSVLDGLEGLDHARREVATLPPGPTRAVLSGFVDHNHGVLLMRAGRSGDGIALLDSAIEHKLHGLRTGADDPALLTESLVKSLMGRAVAHTDLGLRVPALRDLRRAGDLATANDLPFQLAFAQHVSGYLARRLGDVPGALRHYEAAERGYRALGSGALSRLRIDQAEAVLVAGLSDEAARHLDDVLPELRGQAVTQDLAEAELLRAVAALLDGDLGLARRTAVSARRRMRRRHSDAWAVVASLVLLRIDVVRVLGAARVPAPMPTRALRLADELAALRLPDEAALARLLAVRLELRREEHEIADALLRTVPRPGLLTPVDHRMLRRLCRAELAVARGDRRSALAQARAGFDELDRMRDRMGGLELVSGTAVHGRELGELAVRLVLDGPSPSRRAERLFRWLERTRAQSYRYEPVGSADPRLAERVAEVRSLARSVQLATLDGVPTTELETRLRTAQREAVRLGWHAQRWGRPRPVATAAEVTAALGDRAMIDFVASGDVLAAVVLVGGRVHLVRLGSATSAAEHARRIHADVDALAPDRMDRSLSRVIARSGNREARHLDDQLLRPMRSLIGDRDVVIVPTGDLHAVPWGVLPSLRGRPSVVVPSATAWLSSAQRDPARSKRVVLISGPGLQEAESEIAGLAAHHTSARLLSGADAEVGAVLAAMDGAALAHIAAHGEHEPENALFSRLELVDGALFAHEMGRMSRPPEQVVLAACELALHRIRPGDEVLGFAGALLAGGARTVVAATSRVGDEPSAEAMNDYHRALAGGASPAVALADAVAVDPLRRPFVCLGVG
jgi:hypothetical protein